MLLRVGAGFSPKAAKMPVALRWTGSSNIRKMLAKSPVAEWRAGLPAREGLAADLAEDAESAERGVQASTGGNASPTRHLAPAEARQGPAADPDSENAPFVSFIWHLATSGAQRCRALRRPITPVDLTLGSLRFEPGRLRKASAGARIQN